MLKAGKSEEVEGATVQYGFHVDVRRCTGCKTCALACTDLHDLSPDIAFRQVYEYGGGAWSRGADGLPVGSAFAYYLSVACNHCGNPVCVRVCPTGAMHKDDAGLVSVDAARCIGCGYCELSCPYRAPKVDRAAGHSVKCDGCAARVEAGKAPICVEACPLRALDFGPIDDLQQRYGRERDLPPLPDATATAPNTVITAPHAFAADPERVRRDGRIANGYEIV